MVTYGDVFHTSTHGFYHARALMSEHGRKRGGDSSRLRVGIRCANAGCGKPHQNLIALGLVQFEPGDLKGLVGARQQPGCNSHDEDPSLM